MATPSPQCGHSACRQHYIDTGKTACVQGPRFSLSCSDNLVMDGQVIMEFARLFNLYYKPVTGLNKTEAKKLRNLIVRLLNEADARGEVDIKIKRVRE